MTKAHLVANVAAEAGVQKSVAEKVLNSPVNNVEKALKEGDNNKLREALK
jgi:nucleoid DNA-binding protein